MILYYLIKKGYSPIVLNSLEDMQKKRGENLDAVFIEKTVVSKISNRVLSFTKDIQISFLSY